MLMDYSNRRRLNIWGTTRIIHEHDEPDLLAQLESPNYKARVERGMIINIEAIEWNCPQHITPRYSEAEVDHVLQQLQEENNHLRAQLSEYQSNIDS